MAVLRHLVSAFLSIYKKFIRMASKYHHSLSIAAIQGKFFYDLIVGSPAACEGFRLDGPLQSMKLQRKKRPSKPGNPQQEGERTTQV